MLRRIPPNNSRYHGRKAVGLHHASSLRNFAFPLILLLHSITVHAIDRTVKPLSLIQQKELDSIEGSFLIASCGSLSIADCGKKHSCAIAAHLDGFTRYLVAQGFGFDTCMKYLALRYDCLTSEKKNILPIKNMPVAGSPRARVTVVVYVFDMCPLCKYSFTELYREVTAGRLKGKARLVAIPFSSLLDSMEIVRFAGFWDYIAKLDKKRIPADAALNLNITDTLHPKSIADNDLPYKMMAHTTPVPFRTAGSSEVSLIPPVYINGKWYRSDKDPQWVTDAVLYEYEITGKNQR